MKAIKTALQEFVTGTITQADCAKRLKDNACDENETEVLMRTAPLYVKKRTKKAYRSEDLALDLPGGSGVSLTK